MKKGWRHQLLLHARRRRGASPCSAPTAKTPILQNPHNSCSPFLPFSPGRNQSESWSATFIYIARHAYSSTRPRFLSTSSSKQNNDSEEDPLPDDEITDVETDGWEDEEEEGVESKAGDGGDGGGVVLQNLPWGDRALSIAHEVLLQFGEDFRIFSFKITPRGYVFVRLDKLSNEYGCPEIEELESYSQEYKRRLDESGAVGEIPDDLALEVSTPGAERILKVPDDLSRFKDLPMRVCYTEGGESNGQEKDGVFFLDSLDLQSGNCVWKLADVKENRDPQSKGRPLSRKRRDWRLMLPFEMHRKITLYLEW